MTAIPTQRNDARLGILLMATTCAVFAFQDGLSRHLAEEANVWMVVMIRYWFFAAFVIVVGRARAGSVRAAAATSRPLLQIWRGLLLAAEICVTVWGFTRLGIAQSHAILAAGPLIVTALSGPFLGEAVGWRRWAAIGVGFLGILVILRPGVAVFDADALVPLAGAAMFAVYSLQTRLVARTDSAATSFFWTGVAGAGLMTAVGVFHWEPMAPGDWAIMAVLCLTGVTGHGLLIKCYEVAEASVVQPFAYLQLVFSSAVGILAFGEVLHPTTVVGGTIVVAAGLFTLWRERVRHRKAP
ncbi:DMT family transporter [Rubellimicrobium aerolatum]|uniref:DMT family transporter n=1 Tax=Rubellimicrobium aerolatum TaxID=490979 RepID=A0ABW0SGL1_9RHOB|nr:DMT family transporter [Rubellimicrobium aerolatum]MBP1806634.1 drug/metabolite transporter (DMT)-like permease [Rubellimicrobium aerolatum]